MAPALPFVACRSGLMSRENKAMRSKRDGWIPVAKALADLGYRPDLDERLRETITGRSEHLPMLS